MAILTNIEKAYACLDSATLNVREAPSFDTVPVPDAVDYGESLTIISEALHHLSESLAIGQKLRSAFAFEALTRAQEDMKKWLGAKEAKHAE